MPPSVVKNAAGHFNIKTAGGVINVAQMTTNGKRVWDNPGSLDPRFRKLAKDQNNFHAGGKKSIQS